MWGAELRSLLRVFNSSTAAQLLEICNTIAPLKKYQAQAAMEADLRRTLYGLRFGPPRIPHAFAFMVLALVFHMVG